MSNPSEVTLKLTPVDRDLIRAHGYPFPAIKAALDAVPSEQDVADVVCDRYYVELLLGDLARSINDCTDPVLLEDLDALYEGIELDAAV